MEYLFHSTGYGVGIDRKGGGIVLNSLINSIHNIFAYPCFLTKINFNYGGSLCISQLQEWLPKRGSIAPFSTISIPSECSEITETACANFLPYSITSSISASMQSILAPSSCPLHTGMIRPITFMLILD